MNWTNYLKDFYSALDKMNSQEYSGWFTETGSFKFANHPAAVGRVAIAQVAQSVFDQLNEIGHKITNVGQNSDSHLFVEGLVLYHRKDGRKIELPFACAFEFAPASLEADRPMIQKYRSYIDVAPLFA